MCRPAPTPATSRAEEQEKGREARGRAPPAPAPARMDSNRRRGGGGGKEKPALGGEAGRPSSVPWPGPELRLAPPWPSRSVAGGAVGPGAATAEEVVDAEIEQESNSVISRGELCPVLQAAHHGVGETLDFDAAASTGASLQSEASESSLVQLDDGGIGAGVDSSCLEDAVSSDGIHGEQQEQEQGSNANAATGCDEPDGEAEDGALPLAQTPGTEEGDKQFVVWWRLPLRLLHYCAWKVKPVWSFSIAAAFLGLVVLGRRMYRMKRKARGLPQIKIAFDDKRASQFADRAARFNEAFLVARRVPMLRTSSGATLPWSMVQDR